MIIIIISKGQSSYHRSFQKEEHSHLKETVIFSFPLKEVSTMVGARLPACTCPVAGVWYSDNAMPYTSRLPVWTKSLFKVWQGFSLTMKSRNFVRTDFECGTGTPSVCTKIALRFAANRQIWLYRNFSSANSKRLIIFRHEISMGRERR